MTLLAPLATVADLTARNFDTTDTALVDALLASVSAAVRDAAGCPISTVEVTETLPGTREQFLPLSVGPVRAVTSVEVEGVPVTDWKLRDNRLWRSHGWRGQHRDVEVTYTAGFDPVPADIVNLVCTFVGAGLIAAANDATGAMVRDRALSYERVDDYQYGLRSGEEEVIDPTELPERVKASLRQRFGGAAHVIGGY